MVTKIGVVLVQTWLIIGISAAFSGFLALLVAVGVYFLNKRINVLINVINGWAVRVQELEGILKAEGEAEHVRLSEQGRKGVEIREQNKEMRQACYAEGRALLASGATLDEKKAQLAQLAAKYPKVAEEVAKGLIREFGLGQYETIIMPLVAQAVMNPQAAQPAVQNDYQGFPE